MPMPSFADLEAAEDNARQARPGNEPLRRRMAPEALSDEDFEFEVGAPDDEGDNTTRKCRSMVFTLHVNQRVVLDGVFIDEAPLPGWADPEDVVKALPHKYLVFGREMCPNTGSWHLQGCIQFRSPMSFKSIHSKCKPYKIWLKQAWGTGPANRVYCTKEGDFYEDGVCPGTEYENRWEEALDLARRNLIDEIDAQTQISHIQSLERIQERSMFNRTLLTLRETRNVWIVGPTRCGKTSIIQRLFPRKDVYPKLKNKFWCNYKMQPVVGIEDVDWKGFGSWALHFLKVWADFHPFPAERKFGNVYARPAHIFVTSQETISECFRDSDRVHVDAVKSRFIEINLFTCPGQSAFCRCPEHHPELYPDEGLRRVLYPTRSWWQVGADGKLDPNYSADHPIWRQPDTVNSDGIRAENGASIHYVYGGDSQQIGDNAAVMQCAARDADLPSEIARDCSHREA